jgi:hypothetical protein
MKKIAVIIVATLVLASCGGSSSGSDSAAGGGSSNKSEKKDTFASASEMRDALNVAGLACLDFELVPKADREMGLEAAVDVANCEVQGENIQLIVWKDNGQRDNYNGMVKTLGCSMGEAFGITSFDWVEGDRWEINGTSQTLAGQVKDEIGGKAVHHDC